MEHIFEILAPLAVLIGLGSVLAHIQFLGRVFIADLNKLTFWITLPALVFTTADGDIDFGPQMWRLFAVIVGGTIGISVIAWLASHLVGLPSGSRGTMVQSAFRGNLAYIGIPVLVSSFNSLPAAAGKKAMTTAIVVIVLTMALYNILAVVVLQMSRDTLSGTNRRQMARSIVTNPIILAGLLGLAFALLHISLPDFLEQSLKSLGTATFPLALLCIGGSLMMAPLEGKRSAIITAAVLKTVVLPMLVFVLAELVGLDPTEKHIALILACCPTAAAAFIMAQQMGGDEPLASGSIALSVILSGFSIAFALWLGVS